MKCPRNVWHVKKGVPGCHVTVATWVAGKAVEAVVRSQRSPAAWTATMKM